MTHLAQFRRHRLAGLFVMILALAITALAYTIITSNTQRVSALVASETTVERGKALFAEGCSSCHGLQAAGTTDGPSLIGVGAAAVDFQVSSGRMPMAALGMQAMRKAPIYDEEETAALAAYVASLAPGPAIPTDMDLDTSTADLAVGNQLFAVNCAQCHNFAGEGGALTQGKYAPNLMAANDRQVYEAMITGPQNMPVFSTLSSDQKKAILKYVQYLRNAPNPGGADLGRLGPVTEGLFAWTFGFGLLIAAAIWIGAKAK
ncbi:MAG: c-type cytochrome [Actinobacteria bacterium]|nr:c-type cytochrome [Actinomycetota bacterium]